MLLWLDSSLSPLRNPANNVVDEEEDDEETEASELEEDCDDENTFEEEDIGQLESEEEDDDEGISGEIIQEKLARPAKPAKQKPSEPKGGFLNEAIMARTIRLVGDARDHKIVSREEGLSMAKKKNLDLVMVDARANPPVCKIFDYHKEEYKQEKIQKERKKKKGDVVRLNDVKEVRFTSKTDLKDLKMKVEKAKKFMDHGHRVKFVAIHGTGSSQGELLDKIFPLIEDVAVIEQGPRVERVSAWVMLRHVKFGPVKKKPPKAQPTAVVSEQVEGCDNLGSADSELHSDDNQTKLPMHPHNPLQRSTQRLATRKEEDSAPERFSGQGNFEKIIHPSQGSAASGLSRSSQSSPLHVHQRQTPLQGPPRVPLQNLQGLPRYPQPSQGSQGVQHPQSYRPPHQGLQMSVAGQVGEEKLKEEHDSHRLDLDYNDLWRNDKKGANVSQGPTLRTPLQGPLGFPTQNLQGLTRQQHSPPQGLQGVVGQMGEEKLKEEHDSGRLHLDYNHLWRNDKQDATISQGPPQRTPLQGPLGFPPQNLQGPARQQYSLQGPQGIVGQMGEEKLKEEHDSDRLHLDYNHLWRNDKQGANVSQGPPQRTPLQGPLGFPPQNLQGLARQHHSPQGPQGVGAPQVYPPPPQIYPPPPQGAQGLGAPQMYPPPQMYPSPQMYPPPPQMYPPPPQSAQGLRAPQMYPSPPRGQGFSPQTQQIYRPSPPTSPEVPLSYHGSQPGSPFQGAGRYPPLHGGLPAPHPQDNRYPTPAQASEGFSSQGNQRYPPYQPGPQNYPLPPGSQRFPTPQSSQESSSIQSPLQNSGGYNPGQPPQRYSRPQGQKGTSPWFSSDGEGHKEYALEQGSQQSGFAPSPHLQRYRPPPVTDFPLDKS